MSGQEKRQCIMTVNEERIEELIAVYKRCYDVELSYEEAREICERVAQLFERLKQARLSPIDSDSGTSS